MEFILPLIGRLHPLLVHLPIGILLFGIILVFIPSKSKAGFLPTIQLAFLVGTGFGLMSAVSGFLQYQYEGYTWDTVKIHLIAGWITLFFSAGFYYQLRKGKELSKSIKIQSVVVFLLLTITGHFGGNITHGEEYLIEVLPSELQSALGIEITRAEPLALSENSWEETLFFEGAVQPILNYNCTSCHNPRNLKGELDLSSFEGLQKGGENGSIFKSGDPTASNLYARLILPHEDEEHMPPAEKRQPRKEEIELIKLWIESDASITRTLVEANVKRTQIQSFFKKDEIPFYPIVQLKPIEPDSLANIRELGFFIEPISLDNPLLRLSCLNFPNFSDSDWPAIKPYQNHLAYLDLSNTQATAAILDSLSNATNLTILKLNHLPLTEANLKALQTCKNLKLLYLNYTEVVSEDLKSLDGHPSLEKVFVFNSPAAHQNALKFSFQLETGEYLLPKLDSDTIVY